MRSYSFIIKAVVHNEVNESSRAHVSSYAKGCKRNYTIAYPQETVKRLPGQLYPRNAELKLHCLFIQVFVRVSLACHVSVCQNLLRMDVEQHQGFLAIGRI